MAGSIASFEVVWCLLGLGTGWASPSRISDMSARVFLFHDSIVSLHKPSDNAPFITLKSPFSVALGSSKILIWSIEHCEDGGLDSPSQSCN